MIRRVTMTLVPALLGLLVFAAFGRAAATVPTPTPGTTPAPTTIPAPSTIVVKADHPVGKISPAVFGSTLLAPAAGMGAFDLSTGTFWRSFWNDLTDRVYVGSLRFPGGITAESYQWQRAIGPEAGRQDNPIAPANGPTDSTVGPDEFGQVLDHTGAAGVMTVNFATGSPEQAAALVQYMTGAPGSSAWADQRVADGHPAPYHVPWWEVGNEEEVSPYWALGPPVHVGGPPGACQDAVTCLYIYGGTTEISQRPVVTTDDRRIAADLSVGQPGESVEVAYPPVVPGTLMVRIRRQPWTEVPSLATAGPLDHDYTFDPATGVITFGDGLHGAVPARGARITAGYESGPHAGFLSFYAAMKQANPHIHVCASETSLRFIEAMGSRLPYDCLQVHPYILPRSLSSTEPLSIYERQVMGEPYLESQAVQQRQTQTTIAAGRHVPLVLSEYGQLVSSTPDRTVVPYYLSSLDEALLNASQLADWIRLGIPVADRQLLNAELPPATLTTSSLRHLAPWSAGGAMVDAGTRTVVEPAGQMLELMKPLAGERRLGIAVADDPRLTVAGGHPIGDLSVVAGAGGGDVVIVAINRDPDASVPVQISVSGLHGSGPATMTRLDGPSALSFNEIGEPASVVIRTSRVRVLHGAIPLTLPPHSISRLTIAGL
jgi:alpha-N-arabinofuranosidase